MDIKYPCNEFRKTVKYSECQKCRFSEGCFDKYWGIFETIGSSLIFMAMWLTVCFLIYASLVDRGVV